MIRHIVVPLAVALASVLFSNLPVEAQTRLTSTSEDSGLSIRIEYPTLADGTGPRLPSGLTHVGYRLTLDDRFTLILTAPFAFVMEDFGGDEITDLWPMSAAIGNIESRLLMVVSPDTRLEFGLRTGLTSTRFGGDRRATSLGIRTELDQPEAWADHLIAAVGGGLTRDFRLASGRRAEVYAGLLAASYRWEGSELVSKLSGRWIVPLRGTEVAAGVSMSHLTLGDRGTGARLAAYLDLSATLQYRSQRPGVFLRFPLGEEAREFLGYSVGLRWQH